MPKVPVEFTKPIKFTPVDNDPAVVAELAMSTGLRGAPLIRHALYELARRDRARRAREKGSVAA